MTSEGDKFRPEETGLIFIGGIDLTGSTVVDLALGSLPGVIGLGEVDNILVPEKRSLGEEKNGPVALNVCTCGKLGSECAIWGPLLNSIEMRPTLSYGERYTLLLELVKKSYPDVRSIVDSSKEPAAFLRAVSVWQSHQSGAERNYQLIVLRRSPISWLISDSKRAQRRARSRTMRIRRRRLSKWINRYRRLELLARDFAHETKYLSLHDFQRNPAILGEFYCGQRSDAFAQCSRPNISVTNSHVLWGSHHRHNSATKNSIKRQARENLLRYLPEILTVFMMPRAIFLNAQLKIKELIPPSA